MKLSQFLIGLMILGLFSCYLTNNELLSQDTYPDVIVAGAMKNVMWKGELEGIIKLDTIKNKKGLYGLGPLDYLTGELLINDEKSYVSRVLTDSTMTVEETSKVAAPFLVYGNVIKWKEIKLPDEIKDIKDLEGFIDKNTREDKRPFAFKLNGLIKTAVIHIQNLPKGSKVSSPEDAHKGQINYSLENEEVEIIGFFSTEHQGVFTHHDSFLHMHLITTDKKKMGHLDEVEFKKMILYLPVK